MIVPLSRLHPRSGQGRHRHRPNDQGRGPGPGEGSRDDPAWGSDSYSDSRKRVKRFGDVRVLHASGLPARPGVRNRAASAWHCDTARDRGGSKPPGFLQDGETCLVAGVALFLQVAAWSGDHSGPRQLPGTIKEARQRDRGLWPRRVDSAVLGSVGRSTRLARETGGWPSRRRGPAPLSSPVSDEAAIPYTMVIGVGISSVRAAGGRCSRPARRWRATSR